jgi:hypothetical protein
MAASTFRGGTNALTAQDPIQRLQCHWFDQMILETGGARLLSVGFLTISGHGDKPDVLQAAKSSQAPRELVSVHHRKPDIEQSHLGLELLGHA